MLIISSYYEHKNTDYFTSGVDGKITISHSFSGGKMSFDYVN
jgi:hypothetical protein